MNETGLSPEKEKNNSLTYCKTRNNIDGLQFINVIILHRRTSDNNTRYTTRSKIRQLSPPLEKARGGSSNIIIPFR